MEKKGRKLKAKVLKSKTIRLSASDIDYIESLIDNEEIQTFSDSVRHLIRFKKGK